MYNLHKCFLWKTLAKEQKRQNATNRNSHKKKKNTLKRQLCNSFTIKNKAKMSINTKNSYNKQIKKRIIVMKNQILTNC